MIYIIQNYVYLLKNHSSTHDNSVAHEAGFKVLKNIIRYEKGPKSNQNCAVWSATYIFLIFGVHNAALGKFSAASSQHGLLCSPIVMVFCSDCFFFLILLF